MRGRAALGICYISFCSGGFCVRSKKLKGGEIQSEMLRGGRRLSLLLCQEATVHFGDTKTFAEKDCYVPLNAKTHQSFRGQTRDLLCAYAKHRQFKDPYWFTDEERVEYNLPLLPEESCNGVGASAIGGCYTMFYCFDQLQPGTRVQALVSLRDATYLEPDKESPSADCVADSDGSELLPTGKQWEGSADPPGEEGNIRYEVDGTAANPSQQQVVQMLKQGDSPFA
jgi:hypothetical protein